MRLSYTRPTRWGEIGLPMRRWITLGQDKLRNLKTRPKMILGFSVPILLMSIGAVIVYSSFQSSVETARRVRHTQDVIARGAGLGKLIIDMETGERGFLLTGHDEFLEPFETSRRLWSTRIDELARIVHDNPEQVRRVQAIDALAKRWLEVAAGPEIEARRQVDQGLASIADVVDLIESQTGKRIIDAIRQELDELLRVEAELIETRTADAATAASHTVTMTVAGTAGAIFLVVLAALLTSGSIVEGLATVVQGTEELASGDLAMRIDVQAGGEVGQLAGAFNKMAQELQEQHSELEHIYFTNPVGMCLMDTGLRYVRINQKLAGINGKSVDDHIGRTLREMVPNIARQVEPLCRQILSTGEPILEIDVRGATAAEPGLKKDWLWNLYPHRLADGMLAGVTVTAEDVTERKTAERLRRRFIRDTLSAQENERTRIARELHDETGSALTSLMIGLRSLGRMITGEAALTQLHRLQHQLAGSLEEVKRLAHDLHPLALEQLGVGAAIEQHVLEVASRYDFEVKLRLGDLPDDLPVAVATALYRILQEALVNVEKHAAASHVSVVVDRRADELVMVVEDDGRGIKTQDLEFSVGASGHGLHGIRERVALLSGDLSIEPTPGGGTTLFVKFPLSGMADG